MMHKWRRVSILLTLSVLLGIIGNVGIFAQEIQPMVDMRGLTLHEIEALYPMATEEEAKVTYDFISCHVVVDGMLYDAEQMDKFNGQRLHFVFSKNHVLHGFVSVFDLEKYLLEEYNHVWGDSSKKDLDPGYNYYYEDWFYGGNAIAIPFGYGVGDLGDYGMDNCIDSAHTYVWSTLYDDYNYSGWSLSIGPDDWWWFSQVPHDTTSSILVDTN